MSADDLDAPETHDADEPRTPLWLTLLGGMLFVGSSIFFLATQDDEPVSGAPVDQVALPAGAQAAGAD